MQEIILKERYFERELSKSLKTLEKITSFFLSHLVPFKIDKIIKNKRPGTTDQLLFMLRNKFRKFLY